MAQTENAQKTIVEVMADQKYYQITLAENSNTESKWGNHYIGINEYRTWLPREIPIMVAEAILSVVDSANKSIQYTDGDGKPQITRRQDLQVIERLGPFTAEQAHLKRVEGKMPVYPTKIPAPMADDLAKRATKKG